MGAKRHGRNLWKTITVTTAAVLVVGGVGAFQWREYTADARQAAQCEQVLATEDKVFDDRVAAATGDLRFAVIGDSYAQGMYLDDPMVAFPYRLNAKTGGGAVLVSGSGGSGFTADGPCGGRQIVNRLGAVLDRKPPVLIVEAGLNDMGHADERVAVADILTRTAAASPTTKIIVVGPFAPPSQAGEKLTAVRDIIREEALERQVTFVDPSGWDFDLMPDGLHPTAKGHEQIATRLLAEIGPLLG